MSRDENNCTGILSYIFFRFDSPVKLRGRSPIRELKERSLHHIKYENNENQNRRKMNKEGGILLHKLRLVIELQPSLLYVLLLGNQNTWRVYSTNSYEFENHTRVLGLVIEFRLHKFEKSHLCALG